MNKWLIYFLGIITGIILTLAFGLWSGSSRSSNISGLELFDKPGDYMDYSQFEILQVIGSDYALATADDSFGETVFIIQNDGQSFYDNQIIVLKDNQCAQRVGTFKYTTKMHIDKTVPAIMIVDGVNLPNSRKDLDKGITLFDKPGECVSRKNFEVQEVLPSGDAIAKEIRDMSDGYVWTSDLEVLVLANENNNYYNNQILKAPTGKCARQIGNYRYNKYGNTKVIPIIAFK